MKPVCEKVLIQVRTLPSTSVPKALSLTNNLSRGNSVESFLTDTVVHIHSVYSVDSVEQVIQTAQYNSQPTSVIPKTILSIGFKFIICKVLHNSRSNYPLHDLGCYVGQ